MKIINTPYFSSRLRPLPKGCQSCVRGEKMVLFVTGLCPRKCYFCPLSELKYRRDVCFANERPVHSFQDIKLEVQAMNAKGAGLTGGDPLAKLSQTLSYIKQLKKTFGQNFHLHLYTSLNLVDLPTLKKLHQAGLDEIRFHPDLDNQKYWPKLSLARKFSWDVGVEIPLLPNKEKETKKLIDFIHDKVDFLNLNELELADTPVSQLRKLGFQQKDSLSYAVKDSQKFGQALLHYIQKKNYSLQTHLCTVKLKDRVQMSKRIKREAHYSKLPTDQLTSEGLLLRGALYLPELAPGFAYQEKLAQAPRAKIIKKLTLLQKKINSALGLKTHLDQRKLRLLLSQAQLKKHSLYFHSLKLQPALVKEYPTYDQLEIELEFI